MSNQVYNNIIRLLQSFRLYDENGIIYHTKYKNKIYQRKYEAIIKEYRKITVKYLKMLRDESLYHEIRDKMTEIEQHKLVIRLMTTTLLISSLADHFIEDASLNKIYDTLFRYDSDLYIDFDFIDAGFHKETKIMN